MFKDGKSFMKHLGFVATIITAIAASTSAFAGTLEDVKKADVVKCVVSVRKTDALAARVCTRRAASGASRKGQSVSGAERYCRGGWAPV